MKEVRTTARKSMFSPPPPPVVRIAQKIDLGGGKGGENRDGFWELFLRGGDEQF